MQFEKFKRKKTNKRTDKTRHNRKTARAIKRTS